MPLAIRRKFTYGTTINGRSRYVAADGAEIERCHALLFFTLIRFTPLRYCYAARGAAYGACDARQRASNAEIRRACTFAESAVPRRAASPICLGAASLIQRDAVLSLLPVSRACVIMPRVPAARFAIVADIRAHCR